MSVLLSARELTKSYSHRPLFAGLSLDLRAGERVGLIGPNGAGKSTLLRLLAGVEAADEGEVTVRRGIRVGYLAQDDTFAPATTGRSCEPSPTRWSRSAASTPAGISGRRATTTSLPTGATSSWRGRPGGRRRWRTRCGGRRSGSGGRSRPSGGSRRPASRRRPTGGPG